MRASLIAQSVKNLPAMQETWVRFLGREDPLERKWLPTPVLTGESHGQRSLGSTVHGVAKSRTQLSDFHWYHKRNILSKEINLMYSACWEEERSPQAPWRDETTTLLRRDKGSGPAHSPTDDWTRSRPIRFLLSSLSKWSLENLGSLRDSWT